MWEKKSTCVLGCLNKHRFFLLTTALFIGGNLQRVLGYFAKDNAEGIIFICRNICTHFLVANVTLLSIKCWS